MSGPGTGDDKIVILVMSVIPRVIPHTIVQTFYPGSDAGYSWNIWRVDMVKVEC